MSTPSPQRPLPAALGSTENALRSLLSELLRTTELAGYEEWVALTLVDRHGADETAILDAVTGGLAVDAAAGRHLLHSLEDKGILHRTDDSWHLSPRGAALVTETRRRVTSTTAPLVEGITAEDLATTVTVLEQVGSRAREARTRLSRATSAGRA
ncbi:hypothetical protein [Cellulomonas sp. P24]|uniref:hypothetical protein n=1 Tax=Cellulomonas sp. P24 TaxID=2885206 RepID=UPI00216AED66|nr:hypothetical protein [Cellulomonas sp. P24]MCR6493629.1 hypothetical protein [Cellulomonas sp. P24]